MGPVAIRQLRVALVALVVAQASSGCLTIQASAFQWSSKSRDGAVHDLDGWQGDNFNHTRVFGKRAVEAVRHPGAPEQLQLEGAQGSPVRIASKPHALTWRNFISREEARHIVELAAPLMKRSGVGDVSASVENTIRTSYGMFVPRYQDPVIAAVEERVSKWVGMPVSHQEDVQVLRYAPGQVYKPHFDSNGRIATVLIYLNDVEAGGETAFVNTKPQHWTDAALAPPEARTSACARGKVAVKPEQGLALLFYSMPPAALSDARLRVHTDPLAEHTGCPPEREVKWTLTIWIHPEPFRPNDFSTATKAPMPDPSLCADFHASCASWSGTGECEKNRDFMQGSSSSIGMCRKACHACKPCPAGDSACYEKSRLEQGYLQGADAEIDSIFGRSDA